MQRNDPCPCGSGKKYKNCCLRKTGRAKPGPAAPASGDLLAKARAMHAQPGAAIQVYRQVLTRHPKNESALLGLSQMLCEIGDLEESVATMERAIEAGARMPAQYAQLALMQSNLGQVEASRESARRALKIDPRNVRAHCLAAIAEERMNRVNDAMAAARRAISIDPDAAEAVLVLARMLRRKGDLPAARAALEELTARPPKTPSRSETWYELALVCDRLGEEEAAWQALVSAGDDVRRTPGFERHDASLPGRRVAAYRRGLSKELVRRWDVGDLDDGLPTPRFLVGFPRSGTTMTEQILAARPDVLTSDEQPLFLAVIDAIIARTDDLADLTIGLADLDADDVRALRAAYWDRARSLFGSGLEDKALVDKNPMNILDLGLINFLFPEARVLVVIRDPRDVCLSCVMQPFAMNPSNVNFITLEATCALYADVMTWWREQRAMLGLEVLQIRYEDLVSDLEPNARRILDFMGFAWDDDVLDFHEKARRRLIATPSYAAVGQKVNRSAVGRWRKYADRFAPHLETLAPFVEAFGYEA